MDSALFTVAVATNFLTFYFLMTLRLVVPKRTTQASRVIEHFARLRIYGTAYPSALEIGAKAIS